MSDPTLPWLLDKNVVRHALNALARIELGQPPAAAHLLPLEVLRAAREGRIRGVISPELANILHRRAHLPNVRIALAVLSTFQPTRYFKRWARRLRDEGFTREDAKAIALGTFGVDEFQVRFGVAAIVTGDFSLIHHYLQHLAVLQRRLKAMTAQVPEPYSDAALPAIITPSEAVESLVAEVV